MSNTGILTPRCHLDMTSSHIKLWIPSCPDNLKPFVGMKFRTVDEGIIFYKCYAKSCGFSIRLSTTTKAKDGAVIMKYMLCSKEGFKGKKEIDKENNTESITSASKKRKRMTTRIGCRARLVLRIAGNNEYHVFTFEERHNHCFSTPGGFQFLKSNRNLNISHQKFIVDCSKVNIGPVKSYRLYKEVVGGYKNIGATIVDFKNFQRDLKAYIGGSDAQMTVDNFFLKQEIYSGFYFQYDVDESDTLIRLFWADPISRKNYGLFGDMVSFDATYETNRYNMVFTPFTGVDHHKRCVTFGAGLLSKEDVESYVWLFEAFLKAMGHQPRFIITDQDPAIKIALSRVFDKTHHRLCMWHIMKKVPDKVGTSICRNTDFLSKISVLVWDHYIEPEEFEVKWKSIVTEFGLEEHNWISNLFNIRESWVPAYFRNFMMGVILRTTSRSESENNFFCNFTNPFVTLVEFMMRFETAIEAQRHTQSKLNNDSKIFLPPLKTPLMLERDASILYTHTVFNDLQEEIFAACYSCGVDDIKKFNQVTHFVVNEPQKKSFTVHYNSSTKEARCGCKKFEMFGILCRHILWVFRSLDKIPGQYILSRWTKEASKTPIFEIGFKLLEDCARMEEKKLVLNELWSEVHTSVSLAEQNIDDLKEMVKHITDFKTRLMAKSNDEQQSSKSKVIESLLGSSAPKEIKIQPPRVSKNKGSGKRIKGQKEKAIELHTKKKRLCKACGELGNHDSRNCKSRLVN